jgi:hypothetical protein
MQKRFSKIISILFHPLLIPSYFFLIVYSLKSYVSISIPVQAKVLIFSLVFITTFIFPLLLILIMKRRGVINSLQMGLKEERVYPLVVTIIFYSLAYYTLRKVQISEVYHIFLMGSTILVVFSLLINFISKISIHMVGIGGLAGALTGISIRVNLDIVVLISIFLFIAGIIGYSRLNLSAHKPIQVYTGFLFGFLFMTGMYLI